MSILVKSRTRDQLFDEISMEKPILHAMRSKEERRNEGQESTILFYSMLFDRVCSKYGIMPSKTLQADKEAYMQGFDLTNKQFKAVTASQNFFSHVKDFRTGQQDHPWWSDLAVVFRMSDPNNNNLDLLGRAGYRFSSPSGDDLPYDIDILCISSPQPNRFLLLEELASHMSHTRTEICEDLKQKYGNDDSRAKPVFLAVAKQLDVMSVATHLGFDTVLILGPNFQQTQRQHRNESGVFSAAPKLRDGTVKDLVYCANNLMALKDWSPPARNSMEYLQIRANLLKPSSRKDP